MKTATQINIEKKIARDMAINLYFNNKNDDASLVGAIAESIEAGLLAMDDNIKLRQMLRQMTHAYVDMGGSDNKFIGDCLSLCK